MPTATASDWTDLGLEVNRALGELPLPSEPARLYEPVRYVLAAGGKRVRPAVLLLAAEAFGGQDARDRAMSAALGIEVFHNFTLVHDDIMDHAATRRGRPTVHEKWDTATAILVGDLMMGLANDLVVRTEGLDPAYAQSLFYDAVARLCEGQMLDMTFEARHDVTVDEYLSMIDRKTGALLELALEVGALCGGASRDDSRALRRAGKALGRAFQIQDDLLDVTALAEGWGKTVGGDLVEGKRTWLVLAARGRSETDDSGWLNDVLDGRLEVHRVSEVRDRLRAVGVLDEAASEVRRYTLEADDALSVLPPGAPTDALRSLAHRLASRAL
ncbi:polyprenyl synthetase family protein [Rubrivirga sp.]|uniref:polyprenyl synthetase family protein n=1 Tax=Rubrivirga sp. TaxID=1885344 RepID=UPI003C768451